MIEYALPDSDSNWYFIFWSQSTIDEKIQAFIKRNPYRIYDEIEIVENVDLNNIKNYESCIFMFTRSDGINDLNNIFEEFIKIYKDTCFS